MGAGEVMTRTHFDTQMGRLIVLKGWPDSIDEYFPALEDVPEVVITAAIAHALRTRMWFPTPAEVRADCDAVVRLKPAPTSMTPQFEDIPGGRTVTFPNPFGGAGLTLRISREWRYDCDTCGDTGWASRRCPDTQCGRRIEHGPHEFVERCACIDWNPTIRRHRDAGAKYSHAPEKVGA
jgi:hypothetical protein